MPLGKGDIKVPIILLDGICLKLNIHSSKSSTKVKNYAYGQHSVSTSLYHNLKFIPQLLLTNIGTMTVRVTVTVTRDKGQWEIDN